jgi:peptide/nickel transport system substrate-binding protein
MDPAFARIQNNIWMVNQLFNGLVDLNDSLKIQPSLAKSWNISEDGLTYTFNLQKGVFFHRSEAFSGKPRQFIAADVVYSFTRLIDPAVASPGAWIFNDKIDSMNGKPAFVAVNDSTFQLKIKKPFGPMLQLLSLKYCSIVPREAIDFYGKDFRSHPVGTGPFMLKDYYEGEKILLAKNPDYWETDAAGKHLPYIEGVVITFANSKQNEFFNFAQGNLSFMTGLDKSFKDNLLTKAGGLKERYQGKFKLEKSPYLNTEYLGILIDTAKLGNSPLRLKKVRQAMCYAIDRKKMMKYLRNNVGVPGEDGFVPPSLMTDSKTYYIYNPEKARQLLAEANLTASETQQALKLATTENYLDIAIYVQKSLQEIGLSVEIDNVPAGTLSDWKASSKTNFFRGSWIADYADPENYLSVFYGKNWAPDGPNYFHFRNAEFDRLYEQSLRENDESKKTILYRRMEDILMDEAPVIVLFYDEIIRLKHNNVQGLDPNPINMVTLKRVRLS